MPDLKITPPPMPEPEGATIVLGRVEAWEERTGQFTPEQVAARDAQWIERVRPLVEAIQIGHTDLPGMPCGDLLAAANVLRNRSRDDLADRLERKHSAEQSALATIQEQT